MLELLSPAGSTEAVIAAVQSGADSIYMGFGASAPGGSGAGFTPEELSQCLRYCRVRGCRTAVAIGELVTDDAFDDAVERAVYAAGEGADALMVQDVGLVSVLRRVLPETPLWGGVRMGIHSTDGAMAAASMGLRRLMLAPELGPEQIAAIAKSVPVELCVLVHGPLCASHIGQCHMSAMGDGRLSDSALRCAEPCRGAFSLGGRMDDRPLSMPDLCLIERLGQLEAAGVTCAVIGGRGRGPEYVAYVTGLYDRALRQSVLPTREERARLLELFSPYGLTEGAFAETPAVETAEQLPARRAAERELAEIRKGYMEGERRRVPVTFYVVIQQGRPARFAAEDDRGRRAVYEGYTPVDLGRQGITAERVQDVMYRTGGTPYVCAGIRCAVDPHLDYADEELEAARRALLGQITDQSRVPPSVTAAETVERPAGIVRTGEPGLIVQVTRADQLTEELSEAKPEHLYVPAELLAAGRADVSVFCRIGTEICAVLPRIVTDEEKPDLRELLAALRALGVTEALIGSLGQLPAVAEAGLVPRGDFGLNLANVHAVHSMARIGLASVTASHQLSAKQIGALSDAADTEMIVYGRVPVMLTEKCLIRASAGRCACTTPSALSDPFGNTYPVEREPGCRNVVFDSRKLFLADRPDVYMNSGLWGVRLLFTTESARECASVAKRYRGLNRYEPNNTSRGVYPKGVL